MDTLDTAYQILKELINKDCFDFSEVKKSTYEEKKDYLSQMIFSFFEIGNDNLAGIIKREDSELYEGASPKTIENIDNFFKNERLIADIILLMYEDVFFEYESKYIR